MEASSPLLWFPTVQDSPALSCPYLVWDSLSEAAGWLHRANKLPWCKGNQTISQPSAAKKQEKSLSTEHIIPCCTQQLCAINDSCCKKIYIRYMIHLISDGLLAGQSKLLLRSDSEYTNSTSEDEGQQLSNDSISISVTKRTLAAAKTEDENLSLERDSLRELEPKGKTHCSFHLVKPLNFLYIR